MYSEQELRLASDIIRQLAYTVNVSEQQVRAEMKEAMTAARQSQDPRARQIWASFEKEPTVEEFILWVSEMVLAQFATSPYRHCQRV